jgi:hypothetical protein
MVAITIIVGYVINIFTTRWLNKIMYKKYDSEIFPFLWFIPIASPIAFAIFVLINTDIKKNWFTGKKW